MKTIKLLSVILACFVSGVLHSQVTFLDSTFGINGKAVYSIDGRNDNIYSMALLSDGRIVAVGNAQDLNMGIARFSSDGILDSSFRQKILSQNSPGILYSSVALPDDKVLVAGQTSNFNDQALYISRLDTSGSRDFSFGNTGRVVLDPGSGTESANAMAMQADGKIVVAGETKLTGDCRLLLARFYPEGLIDSTFSGDGIYIRSFLPDKITASGVAIQEDGKIVVTGYTFQDGANYFKHIFVARFDTIGRPDSTFGSNGVVISDFGQMFEFATCITLQPDQKILVAGLRNNNLIVARYKEDGSLDFDFAGGYGFFTGPAGTKANGITLQKDDKILVTGYGYSSTQDFCLMRLNTDGTPDASFGESGMVLTDLNTATDEAFSVLVQPDDMILVGGYASPPLSYKDYALVRFLPSLSLGVIDKPGNQNRLLVYPNPLRSTATLEYTLDADETVSVELLDNTGKLLMRLAENEKQVAGNHRREIEMPADLASGVYILAVATGKSKTSIQVYK